MNLRKGSKVWVPNRDLAWVPAEVLESTGKQVRISTDSGKKVRMSFRPIIFFLCLRIIVIL